VGRRARWLIAVLGALTPLAAGPLRLLTGSPPAPDSAPHRSPPVSDRHGSLPARLLRFALTGGSAALLQLALLTAFERLGWPGLVANGAAFVLATQFNFCASQTFTWGDRPATGGLSDRWLRYHAAVAGAALLNMAAFAVASRALPSVAAAALGIAAGAGVNFLCGDRLVFRPVSRRPVQLHPSPTDV